MRKTFLGDFFQHQSRVMLICHMEIHIPRCLSSAPGVSTFQSILPYSAGGMKQGNGHNSPKRQPLVPSWAPGTLCETPLTASPNPSGGKRPPRGARLQRGDLSPRTWGSRPLIKGSLQHPSIWVWGRRYAGGVGAGLTLTPCWGRRTSQPAPFQPV